MYVVQHLVVIAQKKCEMKVTALMTVNRTGVASVGVT